MVKKKVCLCRYANQAYFFLALGKKNVLLSNPRIFLFHFMSPDFILQFDKTKRNSREVPGIPKNRSKNSERAKIEKKSQCGCYMQG